MANWCASFALNHMTFPGLGYRALFDVAAGIGVAGIELRNDLPTPLFGGDEPEVVKAAAASAHIRILALSQITRFNQWSIERRDAALDLMATAVACGAPAICLIPVNDGTCCGNGERQANLRLALRELKPMLEDHNLVGLVEPLGFDICSLRHKHEAVEAIESLGAKGRFRLIHDTFHHFLSGDREFFPEHTGLVHVSGVEDVSLSVSEMRDEHRVLVGAGDRLENIAQIDCLHQGGYDGPISVEAFSPKVHAMPDPASALKSSLEFINSQITRGATSWPKTGETAR